MSNLSAINEYPRHFYPVGRGHALWSPSPQEIDGVRQSRVRIGDVGYIDQGKWVCFFNIHLGGGASGQATHLPRGFVPLERSGISKSKLPRSSQWSISSSSSRRFTMRVFDPTGNVDVAGPHIACSLDSEATLIYAGDAEEEEVTKHAQRRYAEYGRTHLTHWCQFFKEQELDVKLKDLILVTGCTRSASWANSVRISKSTDLNLRVQLHINYLANAELKYENVDHVKMGIIHNSGPTYRQDGQSVALDQCLFLKGYKFSSRDRIQNRIRLPWQRNRVHTCRPRSSQHGAIIPSPGSQMTSSSAAGERGSSNTGLHGGNSYKRASMALQALASELYDNDFGDDGSNMRFADPGAIYEDYDILETTVDPDWKIDAIDYMLENSDAPYAVVHDDDLEPFASAISEKKDLYQVLQECRPHIRTVLNDVSSLAPLPDELSDHGNSKLITYDAKSSQSAARSVNLLDPVVIPRVLLHGLVKAAHQAVEASTRQMLQKRVDIGVDAIEEILALREIYSSADDRRSFDQAIKWGREERLRINAISASRRYAAARKFSKEAQRRSREMLEYSHSKSCMSESNCAISNTSYAPRVSLDNDETQISETQLSVDNGRDGTATAACSIAIEDGPLSLNLRTNEPLIANISSDGSDACPMQVQLELSDTKTKASFRFDPNRSSDGSPHRQADTHQYRSALESGSNERGSSKLTGATNHSLVRSSRECLDGGK